MRPGRHAHPFAHLHGAPFEAVGEAPEVDLAHFGGCDTRLRHLRPDGLAAGRLLEEGDRLLMAAIDGELQRFPAEVVPGVQTGAGREERAGDLDPALDRGELERRGASGRRLVRVGPRREQLADDLEMAGTDADDQRREPELGPVIDLGSGGEEARHDLGAAAASRRGQRGLVPRRHPLRSGTGREQQVDDLGLPVLGGGHQQRDAHLARLLGAAAGGERRPQSRRIAGRHGAARGEVGWGRQLRGLGGRGRLRRRRLRGGAAQPRKQGDGGEQDRPAQRAECRAGRKQGVVSQHVDVC